MTAPGLNRTLNPVLRRIRSLVARCVLDAVDTDSLRQTLKVKLLAGEVADGVEHFEPYGYTSHPLDGDGLFLSVGGSRAHGVALNVGGKTYRLRGLQAGEVALYDDQGQHVHLARNGQINIKANSQAHVEAPDVYADCDTATVAASASVTLDTPQTKITGNLTVAGQITGQGGMAISGGSGAAVTGDVAVVSGDVTADGISLKNHTHDGDSGGETGPAK